MKRLILILLVVAFALPASAAAYDVHPDQTAPYVYGEYLTWTATYPQDARKQVRKPQYDGNPWIYTWCYPAHGSPGVIVEASPVQRRSEVKNADGTWTGSFGGGWLLGWDPSLGALCIASLLSFDKNGNYTGWGSFWFNVEPVA